MKKPTVEGSQSTERVSGEVRGNSLRKEELCGEKIKGDAVPPRSGRVLGVDVGTRTTGLAVSDELRLCVRPLRALTPKSRDDDVKHVLGLCRDLKVRMVVVGLPLLPVSEQEGWMAKRTRGFGQALQQAAQAGGLPLDVELVDERGTSRLARSRLAQQNLSRTRRRGRVDTEAACLLVEEFIACGTEDDVTCDV